MANFPIPTDPTYDAGSIAMLTNATPASGPNTFNPLISRLLENTHFVKLLADTLSGNVLTLESKIAALTGFVTSGASDTYAELPDPSTLPPGTKFVVRSDENHGGLLAIYEVALDGTWMFVTTMDVDITGLEVLIDDLRNELIEQKDVFDEFADEIRTSQSNLETAVGTAQTTENNAATAAATANTNATAANTNANGREPAFTKNTAFNRSFGTANPAALGTASPGNSNDVARINHVHPLPPSPTRVAFAYTSGNTGDVLTSYYFRTQENVVFLVGNVTRAAGGFAGNTHIINLPVGFRPPAGSHVHCAGLLFRSADPVASLMHPAIVAVRPGGAIEVVAVSNVANDITDLIFMMSFRT